MRWYLNFYQKFFKKERHHGENDIAVNKIKGIE